MKRSLRSLTAVPLVCLALLFTPLHAAAPTTDALASGIELCPQFICGSAIFAGVLSGEVAGVYTSRGTFAVSVNHNDLPTTSGGQSAITGGSFQIQAGNRTIRGVVAGGSLTNQGDNTFLVVVVLAARGSTMTFTGVLDHNVFPPTIVGEIVSTP